MSLIRKAGTLGWNVALGSFSQLLLLIEIVNSRSLLKSKFRKHREQLREQCGITVMHYTVNRKSFLHTLEPLLRALHNHGPKYTRHRKKQNTVEQKSHGFCCMWWSPSSLYLQQKRVARSTKALMRCICPIELKWSNIRSLASFWLLFHFSHWTLYQCGRNTELQC